MRKRRERSGAQAPEPRTDTGTSDRPESSGLNERRTRPRRSRAAYRRSDDTSSQEPAVEAPILDSDFIDSELQCSLCHELFISPVAPPCGHAFCSLCHLRLFSVRLPGEPGLPPSARSRPCPLCRQKHKSQDAAPNLQLDSLARSKYPELYSRRELEVTAAINQVNEDQPHYFTLTVGNTCEVNTGIRTRSGASSTGRSDWEFFVELRDGSTGQDVDPSVYIHQVVMHLCGGEGREVCTAPPYLVRRTTGGLLRRMCYAIVYFKPETRLQPVAVTWLLNMNPGRHCLDVPLELCRRPDEGHVFTGPGGSNSMGQHQINTGGSEGAHFGHFASVTGPVARDSIANGPPALVTQEGPVAGLGSLYPMLAGLLESFIRMDNVNRRGA